MGTELGVDWGKVDAAEVTISQPPPPPGSHILAAPLFHKVPWALDAGKLV